MSLPIRHLPVLQSWDCHGCTSCCREFWVYLTDAERERIAKQDWPELAGLPRVVREGWLSPRYRLHHRPDHRCVFLSDQNRCRIHEKYGADAKPLACRLYPFVLVPAGDHWRVSLRYACPSAAKNQGKPLPEHLGDLQRYGRELFDQERLGDRTLVPPPLQGRQRVEWIDLFRFADVLVGLMRNRQEPVERRLRKCLALAGLCRQAQFDEVKGGRLVEFLQLAAAGLEAEVPANPAALPPPGWVGRVLFRQVAAAYLRKDTGPDQGLASRGRLALLRAAWRFARGKGAVPRLHGSFPETTFEQLEECAGDWNDSAEQVLERYYLVKLGALQFCGPTNFGLAFWDGLESLALTYPIVRWLARAFAGQSPEAVAIRAVGIVDNNFGFSPLLSARRQRWWLRLLGRRRETERLIGWYGRESPCKGR